MACSSSDRQIIKAWNQLTKVLLFKFKEYTDLNNTLISEIHDFTTDINAKKDALLESLDNWLTQIRECCEILGITIDDITELFTKIPCICPPLSTTTTEEPIFTTTEEPVYTTTPNPDECNTPTYVNEKGSFYPYIVTKFLGTDIGLVTLTFKTWDIPDRIVVEWGGTDVIDTTYHGNIIFQTKLNAAVAAYGDIAGAINPAQTGSVSFYKDTAEEWAIVKVYAPLNNTRFEFTLSCPEEQTTTTTLAPIITTTTTEEQCWNWILTDTANDGQWTYFDVNYCDIPPEVIRLRNGASITVCAVEAIVFNEARGTAVQTATPCPEETTTTSTEIPQTTTTTFPCDLDVEIIYPPIETTTTTTGIPETTTTSTYVEQTTTTTSGECELPEDYTVHMTLYGYRIDGGSFDFTGSLIDACEALACFEGSTCSLGGMYEGISKYYGYLDYWHVGDFVFDANTCLLIPTGYYLVDMPGIGMEVIYIENGIIISYPICPYTTTTSTTEELETTTTTTEESTGTTTYEHLLGFEAYVEPTGFDRTAQPVDIYDVFDRYYQDENQDAKWIVYVNDNIIPYGSLLEDEMHVMYGTSYRYSYETGGIQTIVDLAGGSTMLSIAVPAGDNDTITVTSTAGFPSSGKIAIGSPNRIIYFTGAVFTYTSKDATHFYGITQSLRGQDLDGNQQVNYVIQFPNSATKRYLITNHTSVISMQCNIGGQRGVDWLYCGHLIYTIFTSDGAGGTYSSCKYIHIHALNNITEYGYGCHWNAPLTGNLYLSSSATEIGINIPGYYEYGASFAGCTGLTGNLIIPDSIIRINRTSFSSCTGFTSLDLGSSVEYISTSAFNSCTGLLGDITIPSSCTTIMSYVWFNCTGLNGTLTIPSSLNTLGEASFSYCNFTSMTTASLTVIKDDDVLYDIYTPGAVIAIYGRKPNTNSLTLRNDTTKIGDYAFASNVRTGSLEIPNTVTTIDQNAFYNTTTLTGTLTFEATSSVITIDDAAFSGTRFTGTLTIPASVRYVHNSAFYGSTGFSNLIFEEGVLEIHDSAFRWMNNFPGISLTIPNSCTSIGANSFEQQTATAFTGTLTLGTGLLTIGVAAFLGCRFTGTITIPAATTSIGETAFQDNNADNFAIAGGTYFEVDDYILYDVSSLPAIKALSSANAYVGTINLRSDTTRIASTCFYHTNPQTRSGALLLPCGLLTIGNSAFGKCSSLTGDLEVTSSITSLGSYCFQNCSGFTGTLRICADLAILPWAAFDGCTGFTRFDLHPLSAPICSVFTFPQLAKPLHIQSIGTSGYDVEPATVAAPWKNLLIFSSITQDLDECECTTTTTEP